MGVIETDKGTFCTDCGESMYAHGTECDEPLECIQALQDCQGEVAYRIPLSGTGRAFPRCDYHWNKRLELEDELNQRYPVNPPSDWSPLDAGEAWGEDDY
jgi:hypothetical protein